MKNIWKSSENVALEIIKNSFKENVTRFVLKQNGEVISKTLLSNDTYSPHNRIVAVGTKQ